MVFTWKTIWVNVVQNDTVLLTKVLCKWTLNMHASTVVQIKMTDTCHGFRCLCVHASVSDQSIGPGAPASLKMGKILESRWSKSQLTVVFFFKMNNWLDTCSEQCSTSGLSRTTASPSLKLWGVPTRTNCFKCSCFLWINIDFCASILRKTVCAWS